MSQTLEAGQFQISEHDRDASIMSWMIVTHDEVCGIVLESFKLLDVFLMVWVPHSGSLGQNALELCMLSFYCLLDGDVST